jgi:release factor glutamine methyltransferase
MMAQSVQAALKMAVQALRAVSDSPQLDAQTLLRDVLEVDRVTLLAHPERILTADEQQRFEGKIARGAEGVPIPYLTGLRAFYKHEFEVTPAVLIPRPETEHLVEAAIDRARQHTADGAGITVADIGTGSGAIALSLAAALPGAEVHAVDISRAALDVARQNTARLNLPNVRFHQGDLLDGLPKEIEPDLIAANLPYIPTEELNTLTVVKHEPRLALDGGTDGLELVRRLLSQVYVRLSGPFSLFLEIGAGQGESTRLLCLSTFPDAQVRVISDYAGHDRVVEVLR